MAINLACFRHWLNNLVIISAESELIYINTVVQFKYPLPCCTVSPIVMVFLSHVALVAHCARICFGLINLTFA